MKRLLAASAIFLAFACTPKTDPADAAHDGAAGDAAHEAPLIPDPGAPIAPATPSDPTGDIDPETRALAGALLLTAAIAPDKPCRITLVAADVAPGLLVTRLASLEPACIEAVPITAKITQWSGSGDGGIFLMGSSGGDAQGHLLELRPTDPAGVFVGTDAAGAKYELHPVP